MSCESARRRHQAPALPASPTRLARPARLLRLLVVVALALPALFLAPGLAAPAAAQSLYGSHESLVRQNLVAQQHDYAYLRTTQEVMQAIADGDLVPVADNADLELAGDEVSFRYARPQVRTFLEQLAREYHAACGEKLVVTSLTRPISRQPWNASSISVHPTGMAVDMRRSDRGACRHWLETTLLALEGEGMIEATRERWPAHYHVAVFPDPLLLPGPIGDPNAVARVAALHRGGFSEAVAAADYNGPSVRHTRVRFARSRGRVHATQAAVARHGRRSAHRSASGGVARAALHRRGMPHGGTAPAVYRTRSRRAHAAAAVSAAR